MSKRTTNSAKGAGNKRRPQAGRNWMPVTDPWIGSNDSRLWCRSDESRCDWSQSDLWTHRIQFN